MVLPTNLMPKVTTSAGLKDGPALPLLTSFLCLKDLHSLETCYMAHISSRSKPQPSPSDSHVKPYIP